MYYVVNNYQNLRVSEWNDPYEAITIARDLSKTYNKIYEVEDEHGVRLYIRYLDGTEKYFI